MLGLVPSIHDFLGAAERGLAEKTSMVGTRPTMTVWEAVTG
jgi:hypothetical protein